MICVNQHQALRCRRILLFAAGVVVWLMAVRADALRADAWVETRSFAAPEAGQAAAADDDFVYAITNAKIAKYDRDTFAKVAESTGAAKHLNSGYLDDGKIYCAHSNYPQRPEKSEIKVLDPATMTLTTFKDFGASDGSLTWAVRHDGDWWCNFAYYDDENHKSYLARFDDDWNEKARWAYPKDLLPDLEGYSLSGGVWHNGELLATDHDHQVIYHLRVPDEGSTLELVQKIPAPFTGQGIAVDRKTGGLVGISRKERKVIFAELQED